MGRKIEFPKIDNNTQKVVDQMSEFSDIVSYESLDLKKENKSINSKTKKVTKPKTIRDNPIVDKLIEYWWMIVISVVSGIILMVIEGLIKFNIKSNYSSYYNNINR